MSAPVAEARVVYEQSASAVYKSVVRLAGLFAREGCAENVTVLCGAYTIAWSGSTKRFYLVLVDRHVELPQIAHVRAMAALCGHAAELLGAAREARDIAAGEAATGVATVDALPEFAEPRD